MWKSFKESFESPDSYVSLALGLAVVLVVGMITFNYFKAKMNPTSNLADKSEASKDTTNSSNNYTVIEGDTLWSIAEKKYNSGYKWTDIAKANNLADAGLIEKGQVLVMPEIMPESSQTGEVSSASTEIKPAPRTYTIAQGDTLWSIAETQYKDGYKWSMIAQTNSIFDPNVIHVGNVLTLP